MVKHNQSHGNHTWDLILKYYECPKCGYIIENREKFQRHLHRLEKEVVCPRCEQVFIVEKKNKPTFGPLLGHDSEIDE